MWLSPLLALFFSNGVEEKEVLGRPERYLHFGNQLRTSPCATEQVPPPLGRSSSCHARHLRVSQKEDRSFCCAASRQGSLMAGQRGAATTAWRSSRAIRPRPCIVCGWGPKHRTGRRQMMRINLRKVKPKQFVI